MARKKIVAATPVKETMGSRFGKVVAKGKDWGIACLAEGKSLV